jgi:pyruvate/2-oxoglutarate dehydrogenase complex dihydrolipoamide acyltransferase (E2) component
MADTASLAYCFTTYPSPMTVKRLSCDFLIFPWDIDGAEAVGFLIHIKDMIEKPERLLLA